MPGRVAPTSPVPRIAKTTAHITATEAAVAAAAASNGCGKAANPHRLRLSRIPKPSAPRIGKSRSRRRQARSSRCR